MKKNIIIRTISVFLLPVAVFGLVLLLAPSLNASSAYVVFNQTMIPLVTGLGIAFTFIVGIFELSVGSQVILAAVIGGIMADSMGFAGLVIGCIGTGLAMGCVMGAIYKYLRIPTMVISLGMTFIFEVIANLITKGHGFVKLAPEVARLGNIPFNMLIAFIAMVLFYVIFYKTQYGYTMRALGNNDNVAVSLGLKNDKIKFKTYVVSGFFYGIAAILTICYSGTISARMELASLDMVFTPMIGVLIGVQFKKILDNLALTILVGAFTITLLFTGLIALGLPSDMQNLLTGMFLLGVMVFSSKREDIGNYFRVRKIRRQT